MRITFVLSSLTLSGGVNAIIEFANRLSDRHHSVTIVVPGKMTDVSQRQKLRSSVSVCESKIPISPRSGVFRQLAVSFSMAQAILPSDVLIATHTPTVVPTLLGSLFRKIHRTVWLYMDYAEMFTERPVEQFLLRRAPVWFKKVLTISDAGQQDVLKNTGVHAVVLKLGLSHPVDFDMPPKRDGTSTRILYLGDARPRKGLADFLHAAEIVHSESTRPVQFVIVSKDDISFDSSLPIEFHLAPSHTKLGELYYTSDMFVSSSWAEGFGLPPLEAMAYGTPVVLTDSRGVRDFARHGENCLLVPPRATESLAQAILSLLNDVELAKKLGENGRRTAARYNWHDSVTALESILQTL